MRDSKTSRKDPAPGLTPSAPWRVRSVRALPGYRLEVCFVDGVVGEVDLSALIASPDAGVFGALREGATFAQVLVVDGAVSWPGGQDLAPDAMHDEIARNGRWVVR